MNLWLNSAGTAHLQPFAYENDTNFRYSIRLARHIVTAITVRLELSKSSPRSGNDPAIFHFVMIKPTHYDDDGYPIQWLRSAIPSNTLACLNALAEDAKRREVLGAGVDIRLHTFDETNRRVKPNQIIDMIRRAGGRALIGLVGVQSNQFPRADRKSVV